MKLCFVFNPKEPVYNNTAAASGKAEAVEQPEYACVIPKKDRGETNNEAIKDAGNKTVIIEKSVIYNL
jgi:hypothetical protein